MLGNRCHHEMGMHDSIIQYHTFFIGVLFIILCLIYVKKYLSTNHYNSHDNTKGNVNKYFDVILIMMYQLFCFL